MNPELAHRLHELFRRRRSARVPFDPRRPVTEHELVQLVEAARWAPTAHNLQNFRLVAVDDPAVLAALGDLRIPISTEGAAPGTWISGAPMVIVVAYDASLRAPASEHDALGHIGLGCVLENMWLAAAAAGLDLQVASAFADGADADVARILAIPSPWRVAFALRVGHAAAPVDQPRVRRAPDAIVGRNRF